MGNPSNNRCSSSNLEATRLRATPLLSHEHVLLTTSSIQLCRYWNYQHPDSSRPCMDRSVSAQDISREQDGRQMHVHSYPFLTTLPIASKCQRERGPGYLFVRRRRSGSLFPLVLSVACFLVCYIRRAPGSRPATGKF